MRQALAGSAAEQLTLSPGEAGMHLVAGLPAGVSEQALSQAAARQGVWLRPLARHYLVSAQQQGLVLGYAGVDHPAIRHGAQVLADLLRELGNG